MKSGPYEAAERGALDAAAEAVASGSREFRAAVRALSAELGRSERGIALLLGRMVRRAGGTPPGGPAPDISPRIASLLTTIKMLSRKRRQLVSKRDALDSQIADVDRRLAQLMPRLMSLTGLPEHVASPDNEGVEGEAAGQ